MKRPPPAPTPAPPGSVDASPSAPASAPASTPASASPPAADPLEALRASSGLSIDEEGRFLHRGEPITHARTLEVLWGSLRRGPAGRWQVRVGRELAYVEAGETPWAVRGVQAEGAPPSALTLLLAGGGEAPLDPATLRIGADGLLRCALPGGEPARFTRAGQLALGALLEEDATCPGRFTLALGGRRYLLGSVAPP